MIELALCKCFMKAHSKTSATVDTFLLDMGSTLTQKSSKSMIKKNPNNSWSSKSHLALFCLNMKSHSWPLYDPIFWTVWPRDLAGERGDGWKGLDSPGAQIPWKTRLRDWWGRRVSSSILYLPVGSHLTVPLIEWSMKCNRLILWHNLCCNKGKKIPV